MCGLGDVVYKLYKVCYEGKNKVRSVRNHANFINPHFFVEDEGGVIPYSIDKSAHLCSCCVELFQVLGGEFHRKLVAPCPGATIFARLKPNRYLLVERA